MCFLWNVTSSWRGLSLLSKYLNAMPSYLYGLRGNCIIENLLKPIPLDLKPSDGLLEKVGELVTVGFLSLETGF